MLMTAQEYIESKLKRLAEVKADATISRESLESAIYAKVMSKKFRKLKADDIAVKNVKAVVHNAVTKNEPIAFYVLFGGNKLWRFDEAPEVDWAELFAVMYYAEYLASIAAVYEPGTTFKFYSQNISVERLNNVPYSETERYTKTFKDMLKWLKSYVPSNVAVTYYQHREEYRDMDEYASEIESIKQNMLKKSGGKLPMLSPEQRAATELNVRLTPGQSDDPKWREKVELEHQSIFQTKSLRAIFDEEEKSIISVSPTPFPGLVALGSTKRSIAKFWAGVGALEPTENDFNEIVLTPKQLSAAKFTWESVNLPGLKGKNFSKIRILES